MFGLNFEKGCRSVDFESTVLNFKHGAFTELIRKLS